MRYVALESDNGNGGIADNEDTVADNEGVTVNEDDGDDKTDNDDKGGNIEMCCPEKVDALIKNELTNYVEEDREWLMTMEEDQLDKMFPVEKEEVVEDNEDTSDDGDDAEIEANDGEDQQAKAPTLEDILAQSGEYKEMIEDGLKMFRDRKSKFIKAIIANESNMYTKNELEGKSMDELEKLMALAKVEPEVDYSGVAGNVSDDEPNINDRQEDGTGVPVAPKPAWNKDGTPDYSVLN